MNRKSINPLSKAINSELKAEKRLMGLQKMIFHRPISSPFTCILSQECLSNKYSRLVINDLQIVHNSRISAGNDFVGKYRSIVRGF